MADGEQKLELKFRIYDGTDICHGIYAPSATVATLKQILVAEWPQGYSHISVISLYHLYLYFPLNFMSSINCQYSGSMDLDLVV